MINHLQELSLFGYTNIGRLIDKENISQLSEILIKLKQSEIERDGIDILKENNFLESVWNLPQEGSEFLKIIDNKDLNKFVDKALNEKAVIHSYNAIINMPEHKSGMLGFQYHRDSPFFDRIRTSLLIMIPLVDMTTQNGATQFIQGSHLFEKMPCEEILENNYSEILATAGDGLVLDTTCWHRAGINKSKDWRAVLVIKYTLAPFKQQIDFIKQISNPDILSETVKQRLGWNVRTPESLDELLDKSENKKWKSGQYDMSNTRIDL